MLTVNSEDPGPTSPLLGPASLMAVDNSKVTEPGNALLATAMSIIGPVYNVNAEEGCPKNAVKAGSNDAQSRSVAQIETGCGARNALSSVVVSGFVCISDPDTTN